MAKRDEFLTTCTPILVGGKKYIWMVDPETRKMLNAKVDAIMHERYYKGDWERTQKLEGSMMISSCNEWLRIYSSRQNEVCLRSAFCGLLIDVCLSSNKDERNINGLLCLPTRIFAINNSLSHSIAPPLLRLGSGLLTLYTWYGPVMTHLTRNY